MPLYLNLAHAQRFVLPTDLGSVLMADDISEDVA